MVEARSYIVRISYQIGHNVIYLGFISCIGGFLLIIDFYGFLIASKEK